MAADFLLLQRYPLPEAIRFRHYGWRRPAFTFGFAQKIEFIRSRLPPEPLDLCRRPTGGGMVDHRDDWTYALVIPRAHPLYAERAQASYRAIHSCLVQAMQDGGRSAALQERCEPPAEGCAPAGICFQRAELYDVIDPANGRKLAGAAQKRSKHGLLSQGSVDRAAVGGLDWDQFKESLVEALAQALAAQVSRPGWPELDVDEEIGLAEQYASTEWLEYR